MSYTTRLAGTKLKHVPNLTAIRQEQIVIYVMHSR